MLSSATGLASVVVLNSAIVFGGEYVDALETYVLVVDVAGMQWTVLQEYVMLFSVPASSSTRSSNHERLGILHLDQRLNPGFGSDTGIRAVMRELPALLKRASPPEEDKPAE